MKYYETLYELLAKQYEIAKMDEAKNATLVQVLDRAEPPEHKSKPKRFSVLAVTVLAAGMFAIICALVVEAQERARKDPRQAERV